MPILDVNLSTTEANSTNSIGAIIGGTPNSNPIAQLKSVNALGRSNLAAKGVTVAADCTTNDIMEGIAEIQGGGGGLDYTATFMVDGEPCLIESVNAGGTITEPTPPPSELGNFCGWKENGNAVVFPYEVVSDAVFEAEIVDYPSHNILMHFDGDISNIGTTTPTQIITTTTPVYATGKYGESLQCTDNDVKLTGITNVGATTSFSVEMWVNSTELSEYYSVFSFNGGVANLALTTTGAILKNVNTPVITVSNKSYVTGEWYHIYMSADSSTVYMCVNGELIGTGARYSMNTSTILVGGNIFTTNHSRFRGTIDEFAFYVGDNIHTTDFIPPTAPYAV